MSPVLAGPSKNPYKKASPREQRYTKRNNVLVTKKAKKSTESAFTPIDATPKSIDDILKTSSKTKAFGIKAEARNRMRIPDGTLVFYTFPSVPVNADGCQIFAMNIAGRVAFKATSSFPSLLTVESGSYTRNQYYVLITQQK